MDKRQLAIKILRYWYLVEFLNQSEFPRSKSMQENKDRKRLSIYHDITSGTNGISEMLCADARKYQDLSGIVGGISVYIGKIERQVCLEFISTHFDGVEELPEIDHGHIALMALRFDKEGRYIRNSFSLSPILWAIAQLNSVRGKLDEEKLAQLLAIEKYKEDKNSFETLLIDSADKQAGTLLQMSIIDSLYHELSDKYLQPLGKAHQPLVGAVVYTRCTKEEAEKGDTKESSHYNDLNSSFFMQDLQMVIDQIKRGGFGNDYQIEDEILQYIVGPYAENSSKENKIDFNNRIDIRIDWNKDDPQKRVDFFRRHLNVSSAPIGKWPSRFMPSLMQQLAINMSTNPDVPLGRIFSVNGPPGTGKTTLLKEVIVHNIVERAKLLSTYADPDEAFCKKEFQNGKKKNRGYSNFCSTYYEFKDQKLKDFGILVASSNNNAVENVTKELPDSNAFLKGVELSGDDEPCVREGLTTVRTLFDFQDSEKNDFYFGELSFEEKIESGDDASKDVYFTKYANELAGKERGEWDRWGLISAALGKRSNLEQYAEKVLVPISRKLLSREKREARKQQRKYQQAVQQFTNQLSRVETLKKEIEQLHDAFYSYPQNRQKMQEQCMLLEKSIEEKKAEITRLAGSIESIQCTIHTAEKKLDSERAAFSSKYEQYLQQQNFVNGIHQDIVSIESCIEDLARKRNAVIEGLFKLFKKTTMLSQTIKEQSTHLCQKQESVSQAEKHLSKLQGEIQEQEKRWSIQEQELEKQRQVRESWSTANKKYYAQIEQLEKEVMRLRKKVEIEKAFYKRLLEYTEQNENSLRHMFVPDDQFWNAYDSPAAAESTRAQVINPWFTAEYNREREKLFFCALQLHKEFVLSSEACAYNIRNLLLLWRLDTDNDNGLVDFFEPDRKNSFSALFNTLFLLTPVLSTTFASAETMLSDMKTPGEIGNLIIDEAGQAQPQMAIGLLYRCRRALVVGDPKQVEPVVSNDVNAIKQVIRSDFNIFYHDKSHSVQEFADRINPLGTYLSGVGPEEKVWVGCPLTVHRRCISPMYDISNAISYDNTMKQQTSAPSEEQESRFCLEKSAWINISGTEIDPQHKNHFVKAQGERALELVLRAFSKSNFPNLFVITPFVSVKNEFSKLVKQCKELQKDSQIRERAKKWADSHIGTVHTFQGKEAAEVIFLLGCDEKARAAVRWVSTNIVNVAVTRAKYRLCVIGDFSVWQHSATMCIVKKIMDSYAIRALKEIAERPQDESDPK